MDIQLQDHVLLLNSPATPFLVAYLRLKMADAEDLLLLEPIGEGSYLGGM